MESIGPRQKVSDYRYLTHLATLAWMEYAVNKTRNMVREAIASEVDERRTYSPREQALMAVAANVLASSTYPNIITKGGLFHRSHELAYLSEVAPWPINLKRVLMSGAGASYPEGWATAGYRLNVESRQAMDEFLQHSRMIDEFGLASFVVANEGVLMELQEKGMEIETRPDITRHALPLDPEIVIFGDPRLFMDIDVKEIAKFMPSSIRRKFHEGGNRGYPVFTSKRHQGFIEDPDLKGLFSLATIFRLSPESLLSTESLVRFNPVRRVMNQVEFEQAVRELARFTRLVDPDDGTVVLTIGSGDINRRMNPMTNRYLLILAMQAFLDRLKIPHVLVDTAYMKVDEYPYFREESESVLPSPKGLENKLAKAGSNMWRYWVSGSMLQIGSIAMLTFRPGQVHLEEEFDKLARHGDLERLLADVYPQAKRRSGIFHLKREVQRYRAEGYPFREMLDSLNRELGGILIRGRTEKGKMVVGREPAHLRDRDKLQSSGKGGHRFKKKPRKKKRRKKR